MPPKTKTDTGTATAPTNSGDLCDLCEPSTLDPSTTAYGCEHGVWTFNNPGEPAPAGMTPEEQLAGFLASVDLETLQKLLDAKTASVPTTPAAPAKADTPAKATPAAAK